MSSPSLTGEPELTRPFLHQPKSAWESGTWGPFPPWLSTPDTAVIETLLRRHLQLPADSRLAATFFSGGGLSTGFMLSVSRVMTTTLVPPSAYSARHRPWNRSTRPRARWRRFPTYGSTHPFRHRASSKPALLPRTSSVASGSRWRWFLESPWQRFGAAWTWRRRRER